MESGCAKASQQQKNKEIVENPQVVLHNNDIPQDVIHQILTILPVKSLLRFKAVSKLWHSTISNPTFRRRCPATSVFAISESNPKDFYLMDKEGDMEKFQVPAWSRLEHKVFINFKNTRDNDVAISNSCNGMLLLRHHTAIFLFNPSTRYIDRVLTLDKRYDNNEYRTNMGFCYDESIGDYKVIILLWQLNNKARSAIVASLKKKEWSTLHIPREFLHICLGPGPLVNDRLHLMVRLYPGHNVIMSGFNAIFSFNPNKDVFEKVALPQPKSDYKDEILGLGVLDDCLCMTRRSGNRFIGTGAEVMKMKEYGVAESWTTLFDIKMPCINLMDPPLLLIKNGDIVFMQDVYAMLRYNLAEKRYTNLDLIECHQMNVYGAVTFAENLCSPKSFLVNKYRGDSYTRSIHVCFYCGEAGHIATDCSSAPRDGGCYNCGRPGHF